MRSNESRQRYATLVIAAVGSMVFATPCGAQTVKTPKRAGTARPAGAVIFQLGKEDGDHSEFTASGFTGTGYVCNVDAGCSTSTFPDILRASALPRDSIEPSGRGEDEEKVTIVFDLKKDRGDLVLRLVRGGLETLDVTIDGARAYELKRELFGSGENFNWGSYNLDVGAMSKGTHTITFRVAPDGTGNGSFGWDALELIAPDRARVLPTPSDAFNTWFRASYAYYGPDLFMSNQAFQHAISWANVAMTHKSAIPRNAIRNVARDPGPWAYPWYHMYQAIAAASLYLRSMHDKDTANAINAEVGHDLIRDRAFAYFVLGMAHASLAVLYDRGFVVDQTTDPSRTRTPVSYRDMMTAAMGYFAKALQLCRTPFTIPQAWVSAPNLNNTMLARVIHSEEARYMAANARTPAERQAMDWSAIIRNIDAGITSDFDIRENSQAGWFNEVLEYGTAPDWAEMPYWIYGMADQSGNYRRWLHRAVAGRLPDPPDGDIVIVTPDRRFPHGATIADQRTHPGSRFIAMSSKDARRVWVHPERGKWRWSWYYNTVGEAYDKTQNEPEPEIPVEEMNLLEAEGEYYAGDYADVAAIINETRVPAGLNATDASGTNTSCVPRLPDGSCGDLWEMLKWEKRMEIQFFGLYGAPWWFDARGWGDLWKDTPLEFPIPCDEMKAAPCYTFGGPGGKESAPVSTYDFPGESG